MKITRLVAQNIKKIKVVEINPDGSLIQISGPNGAGKSSVLDSLEYLFAGKRKGLPGLPPQPIRRGETSGKIVGDLSEGDQLLYTVTRTFNEGGASALFIKNENKDQRGSPQTFLDTLLTNFSFDPLQFVRMEPNEQLKTLRRMVTLDVDLDAVAEVHQQNYDGRRDAKKELKAVEARLAAIMVPEGTPAEPLDVKTMTDALARAGESNTQLERDKAARQQAEMALKSRWDEIEAKLNKAKSLRREAEQLEAAAAKDKALWVIDQERESARPALPKPVDTLALGDEIERARKTNEAVQSRVRREELIHEQARLVSLIAEQDSAIETALKTREDAIKRAKFPLEGLGFDDSGVTFDGLPLTQASSAEQLRISVAMAMSMNPELRIIRIKDGSLLDDTSLRMIAEMAEAADYQVWMEVVDTTGEVGIVLEDGAVVAVNPPIKLTDKPKKPRAKRNEQSKLSIVE